ncbi:MAG: hypothetical protein M3552_20435 [Planctomycetota bacterium]|nr:hypothetical protein [Planctomycetota bacterium]
MSANATVAPCRVSAADTHSRASLYEEAWREVQVHKWIESERRGHDLGDSAIKDWWQRHWPHYCRRKRIEHIAGRKAWREFDDEAFGCLYMLILAGDLLVDRILDHLDGGSENLCVINWAIEFGLPTTRVVDILEQIDVNRARLAPAV